MCVCMYGVCVMCVNVCELCIHKSVCMSLVWVRVYTYIAHISHHGRQLRIRLYIYTYTHTGIYIYTCVNVRCTPIAESARDLCEFGKPVHRLRLNVRCTLIAEYAKHLCEFGKPVHRLRLNVRCTPIAESAKHLCEFGKPVHLRCTPIADFVDACARAHRSCHRNCAASRRRNARRSQSQTAAHAQQDELSSCMPEAGQVHSCPAPWQHRRSDIHIYI